MIGGMGITADQTILPPDVDSSSQALLDKLADLLNGDAEVSLTTADGRSVTLPEELRAVLAHADAALSQGQAVTVEPRRVVLSTQEAADILGVSRPTLIKLLESGDIPFTKPNRHRRLLLANVLTYQQQVHTQRSTILSEMSAEAAEHDAYGKLSEFTETR